MKIIQKLISSNMYDIKCPYTMEAEGICIHNTANDASAENEIAYMQSNNNEVSFHIAVDDACVIQGIPFNRNAWASGDGGNGKGNRRYIHIEICYSRSGGERFDKAERNCAELVAEMLKERGWEIDRVKKHQDFSGKYCPHRTLDLGWQRFINMVQAELNKLNNKPITPQKPQVVSGEIYRIRKSWADTKSQIGAFKDLENAKKACKEGYSIFDNNGNKVYPVEKQEIKQPIQQKSEIKAGLRQYLYLKPHVSKWNVYPTNVAPVIGNQCGTLTPSQFGGLEYEILGNPQPDVYTIQTQSYGKVNIYVPKDNDSQFYTKGEDIKPQSAIPQPKPQISEYTVKEYAEKGVFTCTVDAINFRNKPYVGSDNPVQGQYFKNETVNYDYVVITNKYVWISWISASSGVRRYMPITNKANNEKWGYCV